MHFNSAKIDKNEVIVNRQSASIDVSRSTCITNVFADHSRTIINFHKYGLLAY